MGGIKTENVTSRVVMLGDNEFQSAKITLAAGAKLAAGTVLKRGEGTIEFLPATREAGLSLAKYAAVNPFDIENDTGGEKVFGFRVILSGRVREDMLRVDGDPVTAEDIDDLRNVGIIPKKVTDLSHAEEGRK